MEQLCHPSSSCAICGVVYLIAALAFGTIKKEDVLMLPSGEKIAALMLKYKLLK